MPTYLHKDNAGPVLNKAPRHEDIRGRGGTAPCILNQDTRWRRVVRFTLRPL
jgi:hypothetical protein